MHRPRETLSRHYSVHFPSLQRPFFVIASRRRSNPEALALAWIAAARSASQ
jgi:hypothetical protein